jgi:hypothetical protein
MSIKTIHLSTPNALCVGLTLLARSLLEPSHHSCNLEHSKKSTRIIRKLSAGRPVQGPSGVLHDSPGARQCEGPQDEARDHGLEEGLRDGVSVLNIDVGHCY